MLFCFRDDTSSHGESTKATYVNYKSRDIIEEENPYVIMTSLDENEQEDL